MPCWPRSDGYTSVVTRAASLLGLALAAFLAAVKESHQMIAADKQGAAKVLLASMGGKGWEVAELVEILGDKDIKYTTSPENLMKYAAFMNSIGSIKAKPESWKDLFFPEMHGQDGN